MRNAVVYAMPPLLAPLLCLAAGAVPRQQVKGDPTPPAAVKPDAAKVDPQGPKFSLQINGDQVDAILATRIFLNLRSESGQLAKTVEARETGTAFITYLSKAGNKLYEVNDGVDGPLIIYMYDKGNVKAIITLQDGTIDIKPNPDSNPRK